MSWHGWKNQGKPRKPSYEPEERSKGDRHGNKGRQWSEGDAGTGSTGTRKEVYQAPSTHGPGRTKDVVEHARQVQRDLASKGLEKKRQAEEQDQDDYVNNFQHRILDHLAEYEGEDWLSNFMFQVHAEDRQQHTSQKAIKSFIEEYMDDVVEVFHTEGANTGQYSIRMRTTEVAEKGSTGSSKQGGKKKSSDYRPSKWRRQEEEPEAEHPVKLHVSNLNFDTKAWQLREVLEESFAVKDVNVIYPAPGAERSRGWAIVEFYSGEDAKNAIEWYHDYYLDGRPLMLRVFVE